MRMDLRTDLKSQLRDQNRSSKAAWLQSRWQEVSERERRARLHNQKLLQDFQRAQDTLADLVARTEAMNTIRVEYERYLEQNFPRWQQKLKDKRLLEQRKRIEEHLKACIQQMEEDQRINGGKTSSIGSHSASSISSDPSHPPISHPIPLSRESKEKRGEVHARKPRSTMSKQDNKQNLQGIIPNDSQPLYVPFTWPSEAEPQQSNISKQSKTFQNIHQALNSPVPLPADPRYDPYPVVQQEQPSSGHFPQHLNPWAGGVQSSPSGAPWMGVPVNPLVWKILRMSEAGAEELRYGEESDREKWRKDSNSELQKHQDQRRRRKEKGSDRSSELDTKSACLSDGHGDSIESSALSTVRNQRRRERQTHRLSSEEKGGVSMGSSSRSNHHCNTSNEKNEISKRSTVTTSRASNTQVKSTAGIGSSSECVNRPSEDAKVVRSSVMEKMTKQRRRETEIDRSSSEEKGGVSEGSLSRSDHRSDTNSDKNKISQNSTVKTSRASNTQVKSTAGVGSTKHLDKEREQKDNCKEDRITDSPTAVERKNKKKQKTKKRIKKNEDDLEEKHLTDQEERVSEDGEQRREEKKEEEDDVGDEEQNEEVKSERVCNKRRKGGEKSEGASLVEMEVEEEEDDDEKDGGEDEEDENGGDKEDEDDDVDDGDGELIEKSEGEEDDDQEDGEDSDGDDGDEDGPEEISVKVKAPRSRQIKGGDESDERGNDSEDAASDSKVNINDSLKDLYKDEETEDEELYDQEIEDDIEDGDDDDDDDDDDVVVEKAYPWSRGPAYNHTKYQDDEDEDDVEGLLAPQINIQEHDSDEEKETLNSKDSQSDSEEDRSHRKPVSAPVKEKPKDEPADSDDEFDHFYD